MNKKNVMLFTCEQDTEDFNRLVTIIKQRIQLDQTMEEIAEALTGPNVIWDQETVFLAYHSALILVKDENEFYDNA